MGSACVDLSERPPRLLTRLARLEFEIALVDTTIFTGLQL